MIQSNHRSVEAMPSVRCPATAVNREPLNNTRVLHIQHNGCKASCMVAFIRNSFSINPTNLYKEYPQI